MAFMLPANRYPDIRLALDPLIDDDALETSTIESDLFLGEAERWALSVDPLAATRTGEEQKALYRAIIKHTAALISPAMPQARQINMAGHTGTFTFAETPEQRTKRLFDEAMAEFSVYIVINTVQIDPIVFVTTVSGRRA